ncbi:MAG: hypothetical protein JEZ00_15190 [Anaerolineaceae bacterium]|nr:hypothetical protein [Anaerolineaceae bacterium]
MISLIQRKKNKLLEKIQDTPFIRAYVPGNAHREYKKPDEVYIDDDELWLYFEGNPDVWFFDMIYVQHKRYLERIGVNNSICMQHTYYWRNYVPILDCFSYHERGLEGFDYRWTVDGLDFATQNPNFHRSLYIWEEIARPYQHLIYGIVEISTNQNFKDSRRVEKASIAGDILRNTQWIPDKEGLFHSPDSLCLEDLPDEFTRDEGLSKKLGLKDRPLKDIAHEVGVDEDDLILFQQITKNKEFLDLFRDFAYKTVRKQTNNHDTDIFSYITSLEDAFSKPSDILIEDFDEQLDDTNSVLVNPVRRRQKTQEEIQNSIHNEPERHQRYDLVPSIVWDKKDSSVRTFLLEQYHGRCQICASTFNKRNGMPYFEGLYLVSRIGAQWVDRPGNVLCLCPTC